MFGIAVVGFFGRVLFRLRVEGGDRVPSSGSAIVAGNHVSALDGVALALATDAPVVPVGIWGTQARWPKPGLHLRRPWRPVVAISYGEPIPPKGDAGSAADVQAFADVITDAIAAQAGRARELAEA